MPIRILAIEDDEFMKVFLKDLFAVHGTKENYEFLLVSTIEEAEAELLKSAPDLIMMDLGLPEKSGSKPDMEEGIRLIQRIRQNERLREVRLLVFSGYSDPSVKERVFALGADKYLVKGEQLPREIIQSVLEVMEAGKPRRAGAI